MAQVNVMITPFYLPPNTLILKWNGPYLLLLPFIVLGTETV